MPEERGFKKSLRDIYNKLVTGIPTVDTIQMGALIVSLEQADDIIRVLADLDATSTNDFTPFGSPNYQVPTATTLVIGLTTLNSNTKNSYGIGYADDNAGTNYVELIPNTLTSPQQNYSNSTEFIILIPATKFPICHNDANITTGFVIIESIEFDASAVPASIQSPPRGIVTDKNHAGNELIRNQPPVELAGLNLTVSQVQGLKRDFVIGHNLAVDNVNLQDITTFGEDYITTPTSLTAMEVVSTDAQDDSSGTGARKIMIHGLDANFDRKVQFVTMDGTTPVTVDGSSATIEFSKINHIHVFTPSPTNSQHASVGDITVQGLSGGTIYGKIEAGFNMELATRYTVPNNFTAHITSWNGSVGKVPQAGDEVAIFLRGTADPELRTILPNIFVFQDVMHLAGTSHSVVINPPHEFPEKSEIKVSAKLTSSSGTALVSASFQLWLVPDA